MGHAMLGLQWGLGFRVYVGHRILEVYIGVRLLGDTTMWLQMTCAVLALFVAEARVVAAVNTAVSANKFMMIGEQ